MQNKTHGRLQYHLLSAANPAYEWVDLHDRAFNFWMEIIQKAFREANNNDSGHLHDDFIRQNVIGCLTSDGEIISVFLHSFSSIYAKASRSFRYMQDNYPEIFFQQLKKLGMQNVMTAHYLAVHPDWRKGKHDTQVAPIMIALAQRIRDQYDADAFIGVYRRDRKVHEIAYALGGECAISNVSNHQTPCDLIIMDSKKPYQYPSVALGEQVTSLWENKIDTINSTTAVARRAA
jgi:hypothetical protein